jgi:polysaccharide chain length determinant protein (PEP-CTERM system associated)
MLPGRKYTPDDILGLILRRKWHILIPVYVCILVALVVARAQPDLYESETLVQVLPQRVPDSYVKSTVTSTVEERLKTISEVIQSRTQLEQIIEEFNLFPEDRGEVPMEDIIAKMRSNILIEPAASAPGARRAPGPVNAFKVRFTYSDKQHALGVTQRLTESLINENTRMRGNLAEATNEFLVTQLADARRRLEAQEQKLETFRQRHAGRLPSQLQANMQHVQSLQMQVQALVETNARDRDRKMMLERIYNDMRSEPPVVAAAPPTAANANGSDTVAAGTAQQRLAAARARLAQLQLRLTAEHPDISATKRLIRDLEPQAQAEAKQQPNDAQPVAGVSHDEQRRREQMRDRRAEIESLDRQIKFGDAEAGRIRTQISDYQNRIESVPGIESEWIALTRDYDTLQETYKALLTKSEDSKVAANLERRQIGEQFRVLDPPRVSDQATGANRMQINAGGLGLGFLLGLGLVGFLEFRDTSFRSEADVLNALSLPVLAAVPFAVTAADTQRVRQRQRMFVTVAVAVVAVSGVVFWYLQLWKYVA